jgi:LPS sulfotransferase NodH
MMKRLIDLSSEEIIYSAKSFQYLFLNSGSNKKQKVLVNGSPKTGTTWMLKLVNSIPGYQGLGNFHGEIERYWSIKPGEVVHGHDWYTTELAQILKDKDIKIVLMMRDPRDQLISRVFHIRRDETHIWHEQLKESSLDEAIELCIEGREGLPGTRTMVELTQSWFNSEIEIILVRYEKLISDPEIEFRSVLDYLEMNLPYGLITAIVERNQFERLSAGRKFWNKARRRGQADPSSHFRKGIVGDWQNFLNESHKAQFKEVAGDKLIELGYENDLDW